MLITVQLNTDDPNDADALKRLMGDSFDQDLPEGETLIQELTLTPMVMLELIDAGYKTIESLERAHDKDLKRVKLIGAWRLMQIKEDIQWFRNGRAE